MGLFGPKFFQCGEESGVVLLRTTRPRHNDQVETLQLDLVMTKAFPDQTLETITINRPVQLFLCNGQAQSRLPTIITVRKDCKPFI